MTIPSIFWLVPSAALAALGFAFYFFRWMTAQEEGTERMRSIAGHIRAGAYAYLRQQYKLVGLVFIGLTGVFAFLAYGLHLQNPWVPFAFLSGGFFSGLAGFFGMKTATAASARAAFAAQRSLDAGLRLAFRSGAVMGLVVVGLALLDVAFWFFVLCAFIPEEPSGGGAAHKLVVVTTTMLTFGMGASLQALFARVGGGIFTKAADVGADLVGKVEAGIPEDDPRNPATIADNVGDNVGDVAGMGADLYESFCGAILAAAAIGASAYFGTPHQLSAVLTPMLVAACGTLLSIAGMFAVRTKEGATMNQLMGSLARGVNASALLVVPASLGILSLLDMPNLWGLWGAIIVGLVTGVAIGQATEYFTSHGYAPTRRIAEQAATGPATVVIGGMGEGFISVLPPVLFVVIGTVAAYCLAAGSWSFAPETLGNGLYGIGIAAVGMLSTLGITLATDAYGPIADNAGGNAEMSHLPPDVRKRTDALDALGNTTAATGKGFAIGSAALTALALLASYVEEIKIGIAHACEVAAGKGVEVAPAIRDILDKLAGGEAGRAPLDILHEATIVDFMHAYEVHLMNPKVILGTFLGGMLAFLFCGLTIKAVGRAAGKMVEEVRKQFREKPGIMEGSEEPDYARCVSISTLAAQREMLYPSLIAVGAPVLVGLLFGVPGVLGLLTGSLATGFALAVMMANSGGAWDNAKKYIEEGHLGGKGSAAHKAAVIGDTVGDPFKDTAGPSLNILIKLMSMVSIVIAGVTVALSLL